MRIYFLLVSVILLCSIQGSKTAKPIASDVHGLLPANQTVANTLEFLLNQVCWKPERPNNVSISYDPGFNSRVPGIVAFRKINAANSTQTVFGKGDGLNSKIFPITKPTEKNQLAYGMPAVLMKTFYSDLDASNRFALNSWMYRQPSAISTTAQTINKTPRIIYNKRFAKKYRKAQRLLTTCLQSNLANTVFYNQKATKKIPVNTHAFNRWLPAYLSLFTLFRI